MLSTATQGYGASRVILSGFHPDPSLCRVGDDFYIATSTFEWYPGVRIYHSRDLVNWRLAATPLNRADLLDLRGVPDSCGVWAPCLSYADGKFWLAYTVVRRFDGNFKDTHNYLTTAPTIEGPWSERVYLNSSGFDPSLFHDDDGRKWLLNMLWDHRPGRSPFGGIVLQEYDVWERRLIGAAQNIFPGSSIGRTEAPHLYKIDGRYYLMTAEGGTGYEHAVTIARADRMDGPFTVDPNNPILSAKDDPTAPLQRCGHGSLAPAENGAYWMAYLCSRPLLGTRRSPLGRETALTKLVMTKDGWLRQADDLASLPPPRKQPLTSREYEFDGRTLHSDFQWLRSPHLGDLASLSERPGWLRLKGREALGSLFEQALVARRQTDFAFTASVLMDFQPESFQQMAGLTCYYNSHKFHFLYISADDRGRRHIGVMSCNGDLSLACTFPLSEALTIPEGPVWLRVKVTNTRLRFSWSKDRELWFDVGGTLDASILSDEVGKGEGANFTGAFVGMSCHDSSGSGRSADFTSFRYEEG